MREAAVVYVNGQRAGSVWHPPYSVEVGALLRPGENKIRIVAANLAHESPWQGRRCPIIICSTCAMEYDLKRRIWTR